MLYIGYEVETAYGTVMKKLVTCKDEAEYKRVKNKILEVGLEPIEFYTVLSSKQVK